MSLGTSLGILIGRSHPKLFSCFGLNLKLLWPGQSIEQQAPSLFLDYYKNGYFLLSSLVLVFCHWGQCHWLCQATRFAACPAIVTHVTRGVRVTTASFFPVLVASACCCWSHFLLCRLVQHASYEWLAWSPCRHRGLKPLSSCLGRLFLLLRLSLLRPPLLRSLCCSRRPCWRWG